MLTHKPRDFLAKPQFGVNWNIWPGKQPAPFALAAVCALSSFLPEARIPPELRGGRSQERYHPLRQWGLEEESIPQRRGDAEDLLMERNTSAPQRLCGRNTD